MQTVKVVRAFTHGTNVQLLCADERGLLSVYFEYKRFNLFLRSLQKTGLALNGLSISFDRNTVRVPVLGKHSDYALN